MARFGPRNTTSMNLSAQAPRSPTHTHAYTPLSPTHTHAYTPMTQPRFPEGRCFECSYCYTARGCAVCRVGRGSTTSVRCENCRRNFCADHQSLASDVSSTGETASHRHNNVAKSCAGCNLSRMNEYIDACEKQLSKTYTCSSFTAEQEAYLEQVYGIDVNFRVFGDDWRNEKSCRIVEYNHAHVRARNTSMSPPSAPARRTPLASPQKRGADGADGFTSPPAKK